LLISFILTLWPFYIFDILSCRSSLFLGLRLKIFTNFLGRNPPPLSMNIILIYIYIK